MRISTADLRFIARFGEAWVLVGIALVAGVLIGWLAG
jgi:hypothetical protein